MNDLVDARPFADAANWTSTIVLEKGSETEYPVPYVKWTRVDCPNFRPSENGTIPFTLTIPAGLSSSAAQADPEKHCWTSQQWHPSGAFSTREYAAEPIDPQRRNSPWFLRPPGLDVPLAELIGPSGYCAHLGANTGGASGVYWLELVRRADGGVLVRNKPSRSKHRTDAVTCVVEPELVYPLLCWADVGRYRATTSAHLLLAQDPDTRQGIDETVMRRRYPNALAYLSQFRRLLAGRAAYRRYQHRAAFYSMYNVGTYTVAPIKVVWRRMDRRINAAVVEPVDDPHLGLRAVVPQETCVLVAVETSEEANYLCGLLNSAVVNFLVTAHSVAGGKGFGTPSMLDYLRLARFDPGRAEHAALASASRRAHAAAARGEDFTEMQGEIDRLAARLWNLNDRALAAMRVEG